jgi:ribosomal protein S18 acetylase RimI-like enzyme
VNIRLAQDKDIPRILELLNQVNMVHHIGRPDIFKIGTKYSNSELSGIIQDINTPILVAVDDSDSVLGYAICEFKQHLKDNILTDIKTLYLDDLCVDETLRGQHIGKTLYDEVISYARDNECYNVTLNVWSCNPSAMKFYESCGLVPLKITMEKVL